MAAAVHEHRDARAHHQLFFLELLKSVSLPTPQRRRHALARRPPQGPWHRQLETSTKGGPRRDFTGREPGSRRSLGQAAWPLGSHWQAHWHGTRLQQNLRRRKRLAAVRRVRGPPTATNASLSAALHSERSNPIPSLSPRRRWAFAINQCPRIALTTPFASGGMTKCSRALRHPQRLKYNPLDCRRTCARGNSSGSSRNHSLSQECI